MLQGFTETMHVIIPTVTSAKRFRQLKSLLTGKLFTLEANTSREMQETLDSLCAHKHFDAVLFESVLVAGYRLPTNVKVIIDQHNIEYELLYRTYQRETALLRKWYNWRESYLLKPVEIERCRRADVVLVTSEQQRKTLQEVLPHSIIEVVPNGVDIGSFRQSDLVQEVPHQIIFTGTMNYYPNVDAVLFFAQTCWPLIRKQIPDATWLIVGSKPLPEVQQLAALPGVTVTGSVPDVQPYLAASSVALAPLRIGSGTRLKILEALAMQKAMVTTSLGCEGLAVESGKHLLIADEPTTFAQAVITLMQNSEQRRIFGLAGRKLVEDEYSWEQCGTSLLRIVEADHVINRKESESLC